MDTVPPLEAIDKAIGKQVRVLMALKKEFEGTLAGFDDFVNMVLENVTETTDRDNALPTPVKKMLLNGGHVAMIVVKD